MRKMRKMQENAGEKGAGKNKAGSVVVNRPRLAFGQS
jgi:hypothetical protein